MRFDEIAWQKITDVSLTSCCWEVRLLPGGHQKATALLLTRCSSCSKVRLINALWLTNYWSWFDKPFLAEYHCSVAHHLLVKQWDSLKLPDRNHCNVTHKLFLMCLDFQTENYCSATHILLYKEWDVMRQSGRNNYNVTHKLLGMRWDMMKLHSAVPLTICWLMRSDETVWQKITAVKLTPCWSWNEMCWAWVAGNDCRVTHILLVMEWDVMRLSGRYSLQCHSHPIIIHTWQEIWWNCMKQNKHGITHFL